MKTIKKNLTEKEVVDFSRSYSQHYDKNDDSSIVIAESSMGRRGVFPPEWTNEEVFNVAESPSFISEFGNFELIKPITNSIADGDPSRHFFVDSAPENWIEAGIGGFCFMSGSRSDCCAIFRATKEGWELELIDPEKVDYTPAYWEYFTERSRDLLKDFFDKVYSAAKSDALSEDFIIIEERGLDSACFKVRDLEYCVVRFRFGDASRELYQAQAFYQSDGKLEACYRGNEKRFEEDFTKVITALLFHKEGAVCRVEAGVATVWPTGYRGKHGDIFNGRFGDCFLLGEGDDVKDVFKEDVSLLGIPCINPVVW